MFSWWGHEMDGVYNCLIIISHEVRVHLVRKMEKWTDKNEENDGKVKKIEDVLVPLFVFGWGRKVEKMKKMSLYKFTYMPSLK